MQKLDPALKSLEILEACAESKTEGLGITEISGATGLSRSTVHRLVEALQDTGYLRKKTSSKKYTLGYRLLSLTSSLMESMEIKKVARPYLQQLSKITNETVHLVQLEGKYGVYVDKIDSPQAVGLLSKIGGRVMLHCSGAGKILLAYMNEEQRKGIYQEVGTMAQTENTIISIVALEKELQRIREQAYSFDNMENRDGIYCIAGPIFDHRKEVVASFSVSVPSYRFSHDHITLLSEAIKETSRFISVELGCRYN